MCYDDTNYGNISVGENYGYMNAKFSGELAKEAIAVVETKPTCNHGAFCIPKDDAGGKRGIIDCSKPAGFSVNNCMDEICVKFSYNSVEDVSTNMQVGDYISTVDISDAYRSVNIHPSDRYRQGLIWNFGDGDVFLEDNRLCMGLSSSPYIFSKISDFIVCCSVREGCCCIINYLDDFAIVNRDFGKTEHDQMCLIGILRRLGFSISFRKVTPPAQVTCFLGIDMDTIQIELRLPDYKVLKLLAVLEEFSNRKKATRRELERLSCLLSHCSKGVAAVSV